MANAGLGYSEITDQYGSVQVRETLTCAHCNRIYPKPGTHDPVGFCHMCFKPVCLACGAKDKCDPFERKLDRLEARSKLRAAVG